MPPSACLLTCPHCGFQTLEALVDDDVFYECHSCHTLLTPKPGHDSVFASYGDSGPMPLDPLGATIGADPPPPHHHAR